jgi:DNA-binding GntR family transcriptional regulator
VGVSGVRASPGGQVPPSRTQYATDEIAKAILSGALSPGERLAEHEWAGRLNVSRIPVREALRQLEREGLVEVRARRGAYVARLERSDFAEIYDARAVLEGFAARLCATNIKEQALHELAEQLESMRNAAAKGDADLYAQLSIGFLQVVWDNVPNKVVQDLVRRLWRRSLRLRLISMRLPGYVAVSLSAHVHLLEALRDHDSRAAEMVRWLAVQRAKRALLKGYYARPEDRSELERDLPSPLDPVGPFAT